MTADKWCNNCTHNGDKKTCAKCWRANPMSRMADYDDLWTPNDEWANDHGCSSCKYRSLSASEEPCDTCTFQDKWEPADDDSDWTESENQSAKADAGKPILTLVPPAAIRAIERVRAYGNRKYHSPDNWRNVEAQRHWEAVLRHTLAAWWDFRRRDEESGLMHIDHIMCDLAFIEQMVEEDENGNLT